MRVLLVAAPFRAPSRWGEKISPIRPVYLPLGLAYIASVIEREGHDVHIADFNADPSLAGRFPILLQSCQPDVIGIQSLITSQANAYELARIVKHHHPRALVINGGPQATVLGRLALETCGEIDIVVAGEGENVFPELLRRIGNGISISGLAGTVFRQPDGTICDNGPLTALPDLDRIPFPARWHFDTERYRHSQLLRGERVFDLIVSRGCPFKCTFCHADALSPRYRYQSAERTIAEIYHLKHDFGADSLYFHDDIFTASKPNTRRICDAMIAHRLNIPWACLTHVNCVDEQLMAHMKAAGCYQIWFGIESGVQRLLDFVNKKTTVERVRDVFAAAARQNIMTHSLFIIGLPGETVQESMQTGRFAISIDPCFAQFSLASPLRGTRMYEQMLENNPALGAVTEIDETMYDIVSNIVFVPAGRSENELRKTHRALYRKFYLRPRYLLKILPYLFGYPAANIRKFIQTAFRQLVVR